MQQEDQWQRRVLGLVYLQPPSRLLKEHGMALYDPALVRRDVVAAIIADLRDYNPPSTPWCVLSDANEKLIALRTPEEAAEYPSHFDEIARYGHRTINTLHAFYDLLRKEGQFEELPGGRLPAGTKDTAYAALDDTVVRLLQPLPPPQRVNTWRAACERWLSVCHMDAWIASVQRDLPSWRRTQNPHMNVAVEGPDLVRDYIGIALWLEHS